MYFITNRQMESRRRGFNKFSKHPNQLGPNELTAVEVTGVSKPSIDILADQVPTKEVTKLKNKFKLDINDADPHYVPLKIACDTFAEARKSCKNILIFVHGYNNDVKDVYDTARELERLYNLIVIPFTLSLIHI